MEKANAMRKNRSSSRPDQLNRRLASIRLESEFWVALDEICEFEGVDYEELVRRIESAAPAGRLTSTIRVFVLQHVSRRERAAAQREVIRLIREPT